MQQKELRDVKLLAARIRRDVLSVLLGLGVGHLGGAMSIADVFAVLYGKEMVYDPKNPRWDGRDRLVLSKGHAGPALYAALYESGFFPLETLMSMNRPHTDVPSHPDRLKTPGVDMTTGSLGQGCSTAAGIAMALKKKGSDNYVYLIVGDGELNEGQCWEAFEFIANYALDNCIVFIDDNKKQLDGYTADVMNPFSIEAKMSAFGFETRRVDGRDVEAIDEAIQDAKTRKGVASCIVLDGVKGAGIPYFETLEDNHSVKFDQAAVDAAEKAVEELEAYIRKESSHV
jgi:transketolase